MIRYALKCEAGHSFDSWFQSSAAFDTLAQAGHLTCGECGSSAVSKCLMTPGVAVKDVGGEAAPMLSGPQSETEKVLAELRAQVEKNAEYVGRDFAKQAREIHDGDAPARAIWGEARGDEARALVEDGVPVAPLPFRPRRKMQ